MATGSHSIGECRKCGGLPPGECSSGLDLCTCECCCPFGVASVTFETPPKCSVCGSTDPKVRRTIVGPAHLVDGPGKRGDLYACDNAEFHGEENHNAAMESQDDD